MLEKLLFKKIEMWVLIGVLILGVVTSVSFGYLVQRTSVGDNNAGILGKIAFGISNFPKTLNLTILELMGRSDQFAKVPDRIWSTLNQFDGNPSLQWHMTQFGPEKSQFSMINLNNGKVDQTWTLTGDDSPLAVSTYDNTLVIAGRRTAEDGTLSLTKIGKDGEELWSVPITSHHQVNVAFDGYIYTPVIMPVHEQTQNYMRGDTKYRDDGYAILSPSGEIVEMGSITQMLIDNGLDHYLYGIGALERDGIHLNSVNPAEFDTIYWKAGDLLMSLRHLSMVLIYRPSTKKIIWYKTGPWLNQHDPDFISPTQISVFGNDVVSTYADRTADTSPFRESGNKIYIYDFESESTSTPYQEFIDKTGLATVTGGAHTVFPDGSLYMSFSDIGIGALYSKSGDTVNYFGRKAGERVVNLSHGRRVVH